MEAADGVIEMGEWIGDARCASIEPDVFFIDFYDNYPHREAPAAARALLAQARAVCDLCPVRQPCLEWALTNEYYGIWAGTTPGERVEMRRSGSVVHRRTNFDITHPRCNDLVALAKKGWSLVEIAAHLGLPSEDAVRRQLEQAGITVQETT